MASTYSSILRTELIGAGEQPGTWGSTTNSNFQYIFESAIAGYQAVTVSPTSNNQVLTYVNGPSASPALNQSVYAILKLNAGSLSANFNMFAPPVSKTYIVWNNTSYTATFYNSTAIGNTTAAGSGVIIPAGAKAQIWSDGTNFWSIDSTTGNLTIVGNLTVTGTTTLTGVATFTAAPVMSALTASRPVFTDGSKNLVSSTVTGTGDVVLAVSPALTGTPTAPTATPGTNTTQLATTAFVTAATGTLGTMSTQNANNVNITGGSISGITALPVASGGTGRSTLTANAVITGNGTSGVNSVSPGVSGNLLVSNGTTWTAATLASSGVKLGLGITGETWNNVTGSRSSGTPYTNTNAYPIAVSARGTGASAPSITMVVGGVTVSDFNWQFNGAGAHSGGFTIVPAGATYTLTFNNSGIDFWSELY
jgi:hypothetical protein